MSANSMGYLSHRSDARQDHRILSGVRSEERGPLSQLVENVVIGRRRRMPSRNRV